MPAHREKTEIKKCAAFGATHKKHIAPIAATQVFDKDIKTIKNAKTEPVFLQI